MARRRWVGYTNPPCISMVNQCDTDVAQTIVLFSGIQIILKYNNNNYKKHEMYVGVCVNACETMFVRAGVCV